MTEKKFLGVYYSQDIAMMFISGIICAMLRGLFYPQEGDTILTWIVAGLVGIVIAAIIATLIGPYLGRRRKLYISNKEITMRSGKTDTVFAFEDVACVCFFKKHVRQPRGKNVYVSESAVIYRIVIVTNKFEGTLDRAKYTTQSAMPKCDETQMGITVSSKTSHAIFATCQELGLPTEGQECMQDLFT